jgi:predicted DNA-binding WGR domain protein
MEDGLVRLCNGQTKVYSFYTKRETKEERITRKVKIKTRKGWQKNLDTKAKVEYDR